ncbi:hypothetical protein E1180_00690 [Roseibium denhamense]|uniref:CYTH domain-containing protein n=1 Tax=Roseibium denhamense TaxID=76305 RepID=A0ABY1N9U9_9HYPH|nr:hypothetical protein [Roseibium denhamense]MTI04036.1 hypothetical protein [Roseibium denhamense]SMP04341.1 hypothetical protein SAMN06265374_0608 [Roseibium denhamense]
MNHITSREYKLILNASRFQDRAAASEAFQDLAGFLAGQLNARIKRQNSEEKRETFYLDTGDFRLRAAGYNLRVRYEENEDDFKLTLKYRSADLILTEDASVETADDRRASMKFEEDLLPPFRSVFSRSSSIRYKILPDLDTIGTASAVFPALRSLGIDDAAPLKKVNGFTAAEVFRKLCKINMKPAAQIKLGLSFWYADQLKHWPLIAECAFDFEWDAQSERFDLSLVRQANELFRLMQKQHGWFDPSATTKTRYAYEALRS